MTEREGEDGGPRPRRLELVLPAVHRRVRMARSLVRRFARMDGLSDAELDTLVLVASELLDNAVDHGGGAAAREEEESGESVTMSLELALSDGGWELSVSDQGGADPDELRGRLDGDALPDLEDERGRGFFLLANLVDDIDVGRSADGRGVRVRARRRMRRGG